MILVALMKRTLLTLTVLSVTAVSQAQWTVYDPTLHSHQILTSAKEMAKFVEMIGNQVRQLRAIEEDVNTLRHYVNLFGSPASVKAPSATDLTQLLEKKEVGHVPRELLEASDPAAAMMHEGHGVFNPVGTAFVTPGGTTVTRAPELYRSAAAIQATTENFLTVAADAAARRAQIKAEIAETTTALSKATTDAEVQKLGAVLVGLGSALQSTELEVAQASASVLVQDDATRADERRQAEARKERQSAEFTEALENYRSTFRLVTEPATFPTP